MSETREPRRWNFWLVASLCVNFFLIGVIVTGLIVARNRIAASAMGGGGGGLRPDLVLQMLPQSGALKMCGVLAARTPAFRRLGRDVVEARRAMFRIFRAEPFDEAAFRQALGRISEAEIAVVREREATVADVVGRLTLDERRHFTRQVVQRMLSLTRAERRAQEPSPIAAVCRGLGAPDANQLPQ